MSTKVGATGHGGRYPNRNQQLEILLRQYTRMLLGKKNISMESGDIDELIKEFLKTV